MKKLFIVLVSVLTFSSTNIVGANYSQILHVPHAGEKLSNLDFALTLQLSCCTVSFDEETSQIVMWAILNISYSWVWTYFDNVGCHGGGGGNFPDYYA
jgi:hypothetical protein